MEGPTNEEPQTGIRQTAVLKIDGLDFNTTSLPTNSNDKLNKAIDKNERQICPPNDWISQQINTVFVARKELTLRETINIRDNIR